MELYIHSAGIISAAGSNNTDTFPARQEANVLYCAEPDYKDMIPLMQLRRMSKAVRIGIAASKMSMQQAGIEKPDAISVGTAMGCLQDTEFFLTKMTEQDEQMLTPTAFIQSTHNTVSGQIALLAGCYGHNLTYVHRGHSFEHAMINTALYLQEQPGEKMMVGGIDELTTGSLKAMQLAGLYKDAHNNGVTAGEGAAFFIAGDTAVANTVCVKDIDCFTAHDAQEALRHISRFAERNAIADVDCWVNGMNGDERDSFYNEISTSLFSNVPAISFKHYCGEYATASSFALGLIVDAVKNGFSKYGIDKRIKKVVMVNHYKHYYSCWYMEWV